jgi:hypothetical protein
MTKKRLLYTFLIVFFLLLCVLFIKHKLDSQKRIIKEEILFTKNAIENKDVNGAVRYISPNFSYDGQDSETIAQTLTSFFEEFEKITINLSKIKIRIIEDTARVNLRVIVLGTYEGMTGLVLGEIGNPTKVEFTFIKNEEWLLSNISIYKDK